MNSETRTDTPATSNNTYQEVSFVRSAAVPAVVLTVLVAGLSYFLPVWVGLAWVIVFLLWQLSAHYRELKLFALWLGVNIHTFLSAHNCNHYNIVHC